MHQVATMTPNEVLIIAIKYKIEFLVIELQGFVINLAAFLYSRDENLRFFYIIKRAWQ